MTAVGRGDVEAWLGRRLRSERTRNGWSQGHVAALMTALGFGWHQTTTSKTEAGRRPVYLNEAAALAAVFRLTLPELLRGAPGRRLTCARCGDGPPAGFTCNTCRRTGASRA